MKDIDFDELDKAVSSLMAEGNFENGPDAPLSTDDAVVTIPTSSDAPIDSQSVVLPQPIKPENASTPVEPIVRPASPPPQARPTQALPRRSGRFMDVVHASSDMKNNRPAPARVGTTIRPLTTADSLSTETASRVSTEETASLTTNNVETEITSQQTTSSTDVTTRTTDWPDPIDMIADDIESVPDAEYNPSSDDAAEEPLTSPFLPDAKVEKRPLGGSSPESVPIEPVVHTLSEDPDDQLPVSIEPQLPRELQDELLAVESDDSAQAAASSAIEQNTPEADVAPTASIQLPSSAPSATSSIIAASISQQYKSEPRQEIAETGDIFDTKDYHQPLQHPADKKSGWLWVIGILLLILLGAGAGAAMYLFVL